MTAPPPAPLAASAPLVLRNITAAFGWGFMAVWMGMLVIFTVIMGRDGPSPSQPAELQKGALALFWLVGVPVTLHVLHKPCTSFRIAPDGSARLSRWSVFARQHQDFPPGALRAVRLHQDRDSDGDPYWTVLLVTADGAEHAVKEGHDRDGLAALAERLRAALRLPEPAEALDATRPQG